MASIEGFHCTLLSHGCLDSPEREGGREGGTILLVTVMRFSPGKPYVVLVSPLLFETKYAIKYMRQIVVVSW